MKSIRTFFRNLGESLRCRFCKVLDRRYIPKVGDVFRVEFATLRDRSYLGDVWRCTAVQGRAISCRKIFDHYGARQFDSKIFVSPDMNFFPADELAKQVA